MPSEKLASAENLLKGNLASAWNILEGSSGDYTDLGIARRFGGASAAYSLRDIGAMNGRVVKVRRDVDGDGTDKEEDFSANQVQSGALEDWVNGKLESTLPADVATSAAAYSLRKVKASYSGNAVRIRRSSDDVEVDVAFDSDDKVSASSAITNVAEQGGESGQTTATTLGDFINGTDAFVHTWYDQAGSNDATQETAANQPKIAEGGALLTDGLDFDGVNDYLEADGVSSIYTGTDEAHSSFVVVNSDAATTTQYILGIGSSTAGNPLRNTLFHSGGNLGWQVRDDAGTLKSDLTANPYVANQTYLVSALNSGTTIDFNTNSVINDNGTDADVGASTIDTVHIGTRANSPTGYLNGSIQELVFYASDQSDNRFKIESNINNYYGLYTFQGDGFVETWYDQSANLRDAIQETATNQPKIVSSGSLITVNSKPAITFNGSDNFLEVDGSGSAVAYSFSPSGDMGMFIVSKQFTGNVVDSRDGAGDGIFLQQASSDTTRFRYNGDGSIDITATRDAQHFSTMTLDGTTLSASVDGGTAETDTVTAGVSTTNNLVLGKAFSGNNSNFVDGEIQEAIFYENNKTSEKSDIETDIDNFYSIT